MRTSLSRYQPARVWDADEIRERAGEAWRRHGLLLVRPEDLPDLIERQFLITIAERLHGRRRPQ